MGMSYQIEWHLHILELWQRTCAPVIFQIYHTLKRVPKQYPYTLSSATGSGQVKYMATPFFDH